MILLADMQHSGSHSVPRLKRSVSPPIATRTLLSARWKSQALPNLQVDFPILVEAIRSDLGGALSVTVIIVGGTDHEINRRGLEFTLAAVRPHDAIWFVSGSTRDTAYLHSRVVELDSSDPFDRDLLDHLPTDVLILCGDATRPANVEAWRERAGCTLLDVRSPWITETAPLVECDGRFRLWMGGSALLPHRSPDAAESVGKTATEAITAFDDSEERRSLLRPYVSGLFEYGRPEVFHCAKKLLTYADQMHWPEWAISALSCWYIPSSEKGVALVAQDLRRCFPAEDVCVLESFCGGMFHSAQLSREAERYLSQIGGVIDTALAESPVRYQSARAVDNVVLQAFLQVAMYARNNRFALALKDAKRDVLRRMKAA